MGKRPGLGDMEWGKRDLNLGTWNGGKGLDWGNRKRPGLGDMECGKDVWTLGKWNVKET